MKSAGRSKKISHHAALVGFPLWGRACSRPAGQSTEQASGLGGWSRRRLVFLLLASLSPPASTTSSLPSSLPSPAASAAAATTSSSAFAFAFAFLPLFGAAAAATATSAFPASASAFAPSSLALPGHRGRHLAPVELEAAVVLADLDGP